MDNWKAAVREAKTFIDLTEIFKSVLDVDPIELVPKVEPVQPGAHKDEKTPYGV